MDQYLATTIDDALKSKLPKKSALSGGPPGMVKVFPDNTNPLPVNSSSTVRFTLPRMNAFLAIGKDQTGPYFEYTLSNALTVGTPGFTGDLWAAIRTVEVRYNSVLVTNTNRYDQAYADWLSRKPADFLATDGGNAGLQWSYANGFGRVASASVQHLCVPLMDNYSIFNNWHALYLKEADIVIEITLNNANEFIEGNTVITNLQLQNLALMIPVVEADAEVTDAIAMRLREADLDADKMIVFPIVDVSTNTQSYTYVDGVNEQNYVFNNVSSMVRLLSARLSGANTGNLSFKSLSSLNPGILDYTYSVDGRLLNQNKTTTNANGQRDEAYQAFTDSVSIYNRLANHTGSKGVMTKALFDGAAAYPGPYVDAQNPGAFSSSFAMVGNVDSVPADIVDGDMVLSGVKTINNLQLNVNYNNNTGAGIPTNLHLVQYANRLVAISANGCKVLR